MLSHSVFNPMSPQATAISNLFIAIMIIALVIVVGITGALVYTMIRFRRRPGQGDPPPQFGIVKLEIAWTAVPLALVLVLFGASVATMNLSAPPTGDPPTDIAVIAHQWWWEVRYPSGVVTANEIHIPVGKTLYVTLQSADVVHSLWVPQLGGKMDLVPGQTNDLYLRADKPGVYDGNCVEFCGAGHAWMLVRVVAQPPAQFNAWQRQQLRKAAMPKAGLAAQGARLYQQLACQSCHAIKGAASNADIGPDLTHVASRATLAGGRLFNTPSNLHDWLSNPGQLKPGVHMPNFQLTPAELKVLTAYLDSLQ